MQELIGKVVTMPSRPNTPLRASSSLLCCTMSARKTFIILMPMVFRNGMRRTIEKAMACALSVYLKNSVCHLRPMSVWPSGGIWGRETRSLSRIIPKNMLLRCKILSASSSTKPITWLPNSLIKRLKRQDLRV